MIALSFCPGTRFGAAGFGAAIPGFPRSGAKLSPTSHLCLLRPGVSAVWYSCFQNIRVRLVDAQDADNLGDVTARTVRAHFEMDDELHETRDRPADRGDACETQEILDALQRVECGIRMDRRHDAAHARIRR